MVNLEKKSNCLYGNYINKQPKYGAHNVVISGLYVCIFHIILESENVINRYGASSRLKVKTRQNY